MPVGLRDPEEGSGEPSQVSPAPTAPQTPTLVRLGWQLLHLPSSEDSSGQGGLWDPQVPRFVQAELGEHRFRMSCLPTSREPWVATPGALRPPRVQGSLPTTEPEGHEHGGPGMAEGASFLAQSLPPRAREPRAGPTRDSLPGPAPTSPRPHSRCCWGSLVAAVADTGGLSREALTKQGPQCMDQAGRGPACSPVRRGWRRGRGRPCVPSPQ